MGGLASIGEREENRYRTILGRPGVSNVGISFIEFRHGFNPSPLIIHTDLQLAGINIGLPSVNDSLHISDPNEGGSQNGYYRSAVMVNSLEQPHNPKPFFLFVGWLAASVGLFCLVYVSILLFSEGRAVRGVLSVVMGLLLSLFALLLIQWDLK